MGGRKDERDGGGKHNDATATWANSSRGLSGQKWKRTRNGKTHRKGKKGKRRAVPPHAPLTPRRQPHALSPAARSATVRRIRFAFFSAASRLFSSIRWRSSAESSLRAGAAGGESMTTGSAAERRDGSSICSRSACVGAPTLYHNGTPLQGAHDANLETRVYTSPYTSRRCARCSRKLHGFLDVSSSS